MTDKQLENWIKVKQDWINLKCNYFTRNIEDAKELKAQAQLNMWLYRENYSRPNTEEAVEAWMFFNIKYAYFHILQQLYKKPIYYYPDYSNHQLITEKTILNALETKSEIDSMLSQIESKVSKTASKVVKMKAEGYTDKEISKKLNKKPWLIASYRYKSQEVIDGSYKERKKSVIIAEKDGKKEIFNSLMHVQKILGIPESTVFVALRDNKETRGYNFKRELINNS